MDKDHYGILGLSRNASDADIRKVYLQLALRYHPDKNKAPDAASKFREVDTAYKVLSNEESRQEYDRKLEEQDFERNTSGGGNQWENGGSARFGGKAHVSAPFGFDCRAPSGSASSGLPAFQKWAQGAQNRPSCSGTSSGGGIFGRTNFARQSTGYNHWPGFSGPYSSYPDDLNQFRGTSFCSSSCAQGSPGNSPMKHDPPLHLNLYLTVGEALYGCTKYKTIIRTVMSPDGHTTKHESKVLTVNVIPGTREGTTIWFHGEGNRISGTIPADVVFTVRLQQNP